MISSLEEIPASGLHIAGDEAGSVRMAARRSVRGDSSAPQMRHYLGGEEVHVAPHQLVPKDAELEERAGGKESTLSATAVDCTFT